MALIKDYTDRRILNEPYMPLCIESSGTGEISLAHYGTQNGDLMCDPEIIFELSEQDGVPVAEPIYFRNDYLGIEHYTKVQPHWREDDLCYRPDQYEDLCSFARQWFQNIREQGYFDVKD